MSQHTPGEQADEHCTLLPQNIKDWRKASRQWRGQKSSVQPPGDSSALSFIQVVDADRPRYAYDAIIDPQASHNFIRRCKLWDIPNENVRQLRPFTLQVTASRQSRITQSAILRLDFESATQEIEAFVLDLIPGYDVILGQPFCQQTQTAIDWPGGTIHFTIENSKMSQAFKTVTADNFVPDFPHAPLNGITYPTTPTSSHFAGHNLEGMSSSDFQTQVQALLVDYFSSLMSSNLNTEGASSGLIYHKHRTMTDATAVLLSSHVTSTEDAASIKSFVEDCVASRTIRASRSIWISPIQLLTDSSGARTPYVDIAVPKVNTEETGSPNIRASEIVLQKLSVARLLTGISLRAGYWQVPVAKDDIERTAFSPRVGKFESLATPFQRAMIRILGNRLSKSCTATQDGVVIYSKTRKGHLRQVLTVAKKLEEAGFVADVEECFFAQEVSGMFRSASRVSC